MGYSYSRDYNVERKEWFKRISRYIKEEESKDFEFYCFTLFLNDYNRYVDKEGKERREWGNRKDFEDNLKFFYNSLNRRLYGNSWKKKGLGIKGFICFYEEKGGIKFVKDIGKMNKVRGSHFHVIIKKEKDISESRLKEVIIKLWIKGKIKWNRKFNDEVVKLFPWEKNSYMEWSWIDNNGRVVKERDDYEDDIIIPSYWVGLRSFKFERFYYSYVDVMDREGKIKREKYSWLNYLMKGKWKMISDMSFDVVRNLREEEYEKLSLNSRMD